MPFEQALDSCHMIKSFICESTKKDMTENILPITLYVDNRLLLDSVYLTKTITEKRLQIYRCTIREIILKQGVYSMK